MLEGDLIGADGQASVFIDIIGRPLLCDYRGGILCGVLVANRTALGQRPAPDGSVFLVASKVGNIALLVLHCRRDTISDRNRDNSWSSVNDRLPK